jgi:hypothetical protein
MYIPVQIASYGIFYLRFQALSQLTLNFEIPSFLDNLKLGQVIDKAKSET